MDYPIYIDGTENGTLTVTQEGLRTRFTAKCMKGRGIIRLWVFGNGEQAYLGVLSPEGDYMSLTKSFSRNEMRGFPSEIEYASNAEIKKEAVQQNETKWIMSTNGCLVCFEGEVKYVAIPADGKRLEKTGLVRHIDGGDYLVFRR